MYKTQIFTIAGGNPTLLIEGVPYSPKFAVKYLNEVEQVGFISRTGTPTLKMMGNELSINGTLAFASTLKPQGKLITSGLDSLVNYTNESGFCTIRFPVNYRRQRNKVILRGIGYLISNVKIQNIKEYLNKMCNQYQCQAFGKIEYQNNIIKPFVYVKKTSSMVQETACGSGSLAYSVISDLKQITQPNRDLYPTSG